MKLHSCNWTYLLLELVISHSAFGQLLEDMSQLVQVVCRVQRERNEKQDSNFHLSLWLKLTEWSVDILHFCNWYVMFVHFIYISTYLQYISYYLKITCKWADFIISTRGGWSWHVAETAAKRENKFKTVSVESFLRDVCSHLCENKVEYF